MFRSGLTLVVTLAMACALATTSMAQDAKAPKKPPKAKATAEADASAPVALRAEMHRTMAALIEAQAADKPNQKKVDQLTARLQTLGQQLWGQGPVAPTARPAVGPYLWGGPRMGYGPCWGGRGRGAGRGGPGWYGGPGRGRGPGWGAGGRGRGFGGGWGAFVDRDGNGVCDHYETIWGPQN